MAKKKARKKAKKVAKAKGKVKGKTFAVVGQYGYAQAFDNAKAEGDYVTEWCKDGFERVTGIKLPTDEDKRMVAEVRVEVVKPWKEEGK